MYFKSHLCLTSLFSYSLQVHGVVAWAASVDLAAARAGRYGVPTLKAGPPCPPTATRQNGQTTSKAASECAIGTKICTTGSWVPGTNVYRSQCAVPGCSVLLCVLGERRASRPARWAASRKQMGSQQRMQSANTLSLNHVWSRPVLSPVHGTVWCLSSACGLPVLKPAGWVYRTGSASFWLLLCLVEQLAQT